MRTLAEPPDARWSRSAGWHRRRARMIVMSRRFRTVSARGPRQAEAAEERYSRVMHLPYIGGIAETCRPGSSHGNQMARTPTATSTTPTAWPNGFP